MYGWISADLWHDLEGFLWEEEEKVKVHYVCVCRLSQCLRTQPTAGWSLLTADVWYSPLFHFVSATVFLSWHFRLIHFSRLIIAALQKPHHSARATFQQTCSSFLTDSHRFPLFLVHFPSCLVLDLCIVFFLKHQPHYSRSVFSQYKEET